MRSQKNFDVEIQNILSEIANLKQGLNLGLVSAQSCIDHLQSCINTRLSILQLTFKDDEKFKLCVLECSLFLALLSNRQ